MSKAQSNERASRGACEPFNLFVYGTLMKPTVFRAVTGRRLVTDPREADGVETFLARHAVLAAYKKISPDRTYLYAVPDKQGRIHGYVVGPIPAEYLPILRQYEGRNYRQARVKVLTADGKIPAVAFVGNLDQLSHSFGWEFRDHLKQEVLLRGKIEQALAEDESRRLNTGEELSRQALNELHGLTIRDLIRHHFDGGGISNYAIRQAIADEPLREFGEIPSDADADRLVSDYLRMLVRQVIFNQVEDRFREEFRYDLDRIQMSNKFYERAISALAALRTLNAQPKLMELLTGDILEELSFRSDRLVDYVRRAIRSAETVYDPARARQEIQYIRNHMGGGGLPLGAELEFSNIGHNVIGNSTANGKCRDEQYDGFLYFRDFALDILTWKLGGHLDDHRTKSSPRRRRGFFELALGSLSVEANISKPVTDDPWLLNQCIHAVMEFYDISPHSLHISLQLRSPNKPVRDRPVPLGVMKCLFALTSDMVRRDDGRIEIARLAGGEIVGSKAGMHMLFSDTSRRHSVEDGSRAPASPPGRGRWVQQFKFLRLAKDINYEPIIVALKGLQVHFKPGSFLTASQYQSNPALREIFEEMIRWGRAVEPLGTDEMEQFLSGVYDGLMHERRGRPVHNQAYINYCLSNLLTGLNEFNKTARGS
jgi:gamma-glutamylcyclotransferase (GGCT)/AIG2-like uncharacterized protein YtfP